MNFLVTGGAGFIGSHVCERLLHSGHSVWAFDDLNAFYDPQIKRGNIRDIQSLAKPFEFIQGDITDRAALDEVFGSVKFDQIVHLAARAGVRGTAGQHAGHGHGQAEDPRSASGQEASCTFAVMPPSGVTRWWPLIRTIAW